MKFSQFISKGNSSFLLEDEQSEWKVFQASLIALQKKFEDCADRDETDISVLFKDLKKAIKEAGKFVKFKDKEISKAAKLIKTGLESLLASGMAIKASYSD